MTLLTLEDLPAHRPWRAVPAWGGRWLGDPAAGVLTLWTLQAPDAYRELASTGVLRADPARRDPVYRRAYDWMERAASDRLPTSGDALLWCWARTTRANLRPSGRPPSRGSVLLTARVPRTHALLSHVDAWHTCLNDLPFVTPLPDESEDAWWARSEPALEAFWSRCDAERGVSADARAALEASWAGVLDASWWTPTDHLQAVVHELHADHVVRAVRIR